MEHPPDTPEPNPELVAEEEAAAAAEAGAIGGSGGPTVGDPAMRPVSEGGGGEAEGFELAEQDLVENATHGDGKARPLRDGFSPEAERDGATHGEPDDVREAGADD